LNLLFRQLIKNCPRFNHKCWFEAIDPARISEDEAAEYDKLRLFSTSINGLADWHVIRQAESPGTEINIEHTILSYISKYSPAWENYISAVRQEITERAADWNESRWLQKYRPPGRHL
jgi:hypothetical protein